MKNVLLVVSITWSISTTAPVHAQLIINLNMTQLPSNQTPFGPNWTYMSGPTTPLPESPTFSVGLNGASEPTLFIDTMPDNLASPDGTGYFLDGLLVPAQSAYSVNFRARVIQDETAGNHFGLSFQVAYGGKSVLIGFGPTLLQAGDALGTHDIMTGLDNTGYHNYQLDGDVIAGTWSLRRDTFLMGTGNMANSAANRLFLGDGSGASNAQSEVTLYTFLSVPEPNAMLLCGIALIGWKLRKRR